jgi:hypothetical protein
MQLTGSSTDVTTIENATVSQNFPSHQASNKDGSNACAHG